MNNLVWRMAIKAKFEHLGYINRLTTEIFMTLTSTARRLTRLSLAASVVLAGFAAQAQSAQAYSFETFSDRNGDSVVTDVDYDLYAKGANRTFTTKGVIESRIGNNNTNGDWELGSFTSTYSADGSTYSNVANAGSQRQQKWKNGIAEAFTMTYDGSNLIYTVDGQTTTQSIAGVTDLLLRTRAGKSKSGVNLSNMTLFDNLGNTKATWANQGSSTTSAAVDIDYLRVADLKPGFKLTGNTTMSWAGTTPPTGSNLALQWKIGTIPGPTKSVPEPGSMAAIAIVGAMAVRKKMKK